MRIAVYGVGGVGGYFGGRLAEVGEDVTFIARGEHLKRIQADGLRVESILGDFTIHPARAAEDPKRVGEVDAVVVGVKAWQVPEAAEAMRPLVGPETCVLPLQNGVDAPAQLRAVLGSEAVLGGLCQISAFIAEPGVIRHVGIEPTVMLGELDRRPSERTQRLLEAFQRAGVKASIPDDIQVAMWEKFLFIASISGVCGVSRAPAGVVRTTPETRQLLERAMQEIVAVSKSRRINLPEDAVARRMAFVDGIAPGVIPSMVRDILDGRPSELGSQNGAVVRMGLEAGIPTPTHAFIFGALLPQELRARGDVNF